MRRARSRPATRIACSELRSWMRRTSAPSRTASVDRGDRPPLALARRQPLLPGAGQDGADEVLARERDVERQPERAQLAEPPQDLQVLLGAEVEVESGVDRDLLLGDAKLPGQLDSPLEPGLAGGRRRRRTRARAGRPAAAPRCASARSRSRVSATSSNISSEPPEMSLTATAPAASARRATSAEKVSAETGTPPTLCRRSAVPRSPGPAPPPRPRRGTGGPAARRHGADVEHVEARLDQRQAVGDRLLRRAAARALEHRVDGDVDDPGRQRLRQVEGPVGQPPAHRRYGSDRADAAALRLHRPRRDPARAGQLALPRRRGRLLAGAGARRSRPATGPGSRS